MRTFADMSLISRITVLSLAAFLGQSLTACDGKDSDQDEESETEGDDEEDSDSDGDGDGDGDEKSDGDGGKAGDSGDGDDDKPKDKDDGDAAGDTDLTWWRDVKPIIEKKCVNCHAKGQIGGISLETYEEVMEHKKMVEHSVQSGAMPPWSPRKDCRKYSHDRSLSDKQKSTLLSWIKGGAPEGDSRTAPDVEDAKEEPIPYNMEMGMSEAWTPRGTDENRCFLAEWPGKKTQYQKAFQVMPGEAAMLHHLLVYKVSKSQAQKFYGFDRKDPGYGYNCPGGPAPNVHPNEVQLIGDWVPGQSDAPLPDGVGIRYEPGDLIIFQHHYNTAFTGAKPDKSSYKFHFVDEVERPAAASLFFNPMWLIPGLMPIQPGEADAKVEWSFNVGQNLGKLAAQEIPGMSASEPLQIHYVGPHLHQLGSKAYVNVIRADGSKECLMETDNYDFDWQGFYTIEDEVIVQPSDSISLRCHWNNTKENQRPMPDGTIPEPKFVSWGDRTRDEMCLLGVMVTRPKK